MAYLEDHEKEEYSRRVCALAQVSSPPRLPFLAPPPRPLSFSLSRSLPPCPVPDSLSHHPDNTLLIPLLLPVCVLLQVLKAHFQPDSQGTAVLRTKLTKILGAADTDRLLCASVQPLQGTCPHPICGMCSTCMPLSPCLEPLLPAVLSDRRAT